MVFAPEKTGPLNTPSWGKDGVKHQGVLHSYSGSTEDSEIRWANWKDPNGTLGVGTEHGNPKKKCPAMERAADQVSVPTEDIPK